MIDSYSFGRIVVDGVSYSRDLIILPDKIITTWWRREGHRLSVDDLKDIETVNIDNLVIGTGAYGLMKVDEGIKRKLEKRGIKVFAAPTKKAVEIYNSLEGEKAGCFHLTC